MKNFAATAAIGALTATSAYSYVLPNAQGDKWLNGEENVPAGPSFANLGKRNSGKSIRMDLTHNKRQPLNTPNKVLEFAEKQAAYVKAKYGTRSEDEEARKRQVAGLIDYGPDSFYFAQVAVGTPEQHFNVILDTGSADFWLTDAQCTSSQCSGVALYNPGNSNSDTTSTTPFQITYGSGAVRGTLYADTVSLAGYTVYNQTLAGVTQLAEGTLTSPTSGIMGMAFQTLATSGATPFWEVLALSGTLGTPAFTFQLSRNSMASQSALNSGGTFTLGEIDQNQYSGDITYTNLPNTQAGQRGYWAIPLDSVNVNNNNVNTNGQLAAIDTGTTLIGAPSDVVQQIYANIQDSTPVQSGSSGSAAYYAYPCSANVDVSFTFSGRSFSMDAADFNGGNVGTGNDGTPYCVGSIFATDLGTGAPDWIIGDSFLKNVFSVFESSPQRVGFANLKTAGVAQNAPVTLSVVPSGAAANNVASTAAATGASTTGGGVQPPSAAANTQSASNIVGGSGLPNPVPAGSAAGSTQPLTSSASPAAPVATSSSVPVAASAVTAVTGTSSLVPTSVTNPIASVSTTAPTSDEVPASSASSSVISSATVTSTNPTDGSLSTSTSLATLQPTLSTGNSIDQSASGSTALVVSTTLLCAFVALVAGASVL